MKAACLLFTILISCTTQGQVDNTNKIIVDKTKAHLANLSKQGKFSGAVLIAKDGIPIFREAYGLASISFNVPNKVDTKFNLASMGKMFTATAIMQLYERGKLDLQDKVIKYLPDYPNRKTASSVTIHQLLTHTSGMGNYWTDEYSKTSKERFKELRDYLPLFANQELRFTPGARFGYSNSGFMVLGMIIESISNQSYFDFVKENIFDPAGMINTDSYELDTPVPNLAVGYIRSTDGLWMNNLFLHVVKGGPAGGGYSTVDDLLNFSMYLIDNKFLNSQNTKILTEGKWKRGNNKSYAYGFGEEIITNDRIIGHNGGFPGIRTVLMIFPESGYMAVILSNKDDGSFERIYSLIKNQITNVIK